MRAMIRIVSSEKGKGAVSLNEVSREENISLKYLEGIVGLLKKNGLVASVKGPKGGYVIARPKDKISLLDIARALEGEVNFVDCCGEDFACERKKICTTYETWYELSSMLQKQMESIKLSELVKKAENSQQKAESKRKKGL